jgi:hypothetical protein
MCLREKIGPDPRNFNQRVSLGRNDLLIRTFPNIFIISDAVTIPCLIEAARYNILSLRASMSLNSGWLLI